MGKDVRWNRGGEALGKMHGDLQKSAKDTTLKPSLFAAFNTD